MEDCNKVCSPIVQGCNLVKGERDKVVDASIYKLMVGSLMYLMATRPDMGFSVCLVIRYMERSTEMHIATIKRIMRYLQGTLEFDILYQHESTNNLLLLG